MAKIFWKQVGSLQTFLDDFIFYREQIREIFPIEILIDNNSERQHFCLSTFWIIALSRLWSIIITNRIIVVTLEYMSVYVWEINNNNRMLFLADNPVLNFTSINE